MGPPYKNQSKIKRWIVEMWFCVSLWQIPSLRLLLQSQQCIQMFNKLSWFFHWWIWLSKYRLGIDFETVTRKKYAVLFYWRMFQHSLYTSSYKIWKFMNIVDLNTSFWDNHCWYIKCCGFSWENNLFQKICWRFVGSSGTHFLH